MIRERQHPRPEQKTEIAKNPGRTQKCSHQFPRRHTHTCWESRQGLGYVELRTEDLTRGADFNMKISGAQATAQFAVVLVLVPVSQVGSDDDIGAGELH